MRKGYVQVYTGHGKGKTTAALGLAVRAAGSGLKVFIAQFIKKQRCGEHQALERFSDQIEVHQYGCGFIKGNKPSTTDIRNAQAGLREAGEALRSKRYDIVILDEANVAVRYGLIEAQDLLDLIDDRPASVELVITGRYADDRVVDAADLVTEMREIKHYHSKGVTARRGIEK